MAAAAAAAPSMHGEQLYRSDPRQARTQMAPPPWAGVPVWREQTHAPVLARASDVQLGYLLGTYAIDNLTVGRDREKLDDFYGAIKRYLFAEEQFRLSADSYTSARDELKARNSREGRAGVLRDLIRVYTRVAQMQSVRAEHEADTMARLQAKMTDMLGDQSLSNISLMSEVDFKQFTQHMRPSKLRLVTDAITDYTRGLVAYAMAVRMAETANNELSTMQADLLEAELHARPPPAVSIA